MKKIAIFLLPILFALYLSGGQSTATDYPWPWDTFKQVSTLMSDSLSTAVIDSGNVNAGGLSVTDISNGGNGFTTKVSVRDSVAAWIARSDSSLFPDGKLSIAEIQQLSVRLGELILKAALADSLATNYGIQESGVAWIDSSHVKDASISGADLVNPLRYTGSGYVTGLWQADSLKVSNTGTNNSYLQSWWKNGVKKAYIDTVGYLSVNRIGLNNASPVYAIDLGANDIYMGVKVISTNNNQELTISPYDLTISSRVIGMTGSNMVTISGVPLILTGNVGSGTTAPVASSLTLGSSATQKDLVVTREQTPAASDSSFKVTIASGNPQTIYNASDGDTYTQTINASDQAVFSGAAGGYTFDAPIKTTAIYNKFALNATLPDTTGFVGGETWYSAIGDTTYIYKSNHTIRSQP